MDKKDSKVKTTRKNECFVERGLRVLTGVNQRVIRAKDEMRLLEEVCKLIVSEGYVYAWVGYARDDKTVKTVAKAGKNGYADTIEVTWDESETGMGPTGTAIRERRVTIAKDIAEDKAFQPWREEAVKRGFASSISLPLIYGSDVFGALNVYASEKDAFDDGEVKLLKEVADNLAYAITMLRSRRREERTRGVVNFLWELTTKDLDYESFLKEALHGILKITKSTHGFLGSLSDGKDLVLLAWSENVMEDCHVIDFEFLAERGGFLAEAMKKKKTIVNDYERHPEKRLPEGHIPLKRFIIVPIEGEGLSIAGVANKDEDYTEDDAELLEFFMKNVQGMLEKKKIEEIYRTLIENTGTAMVISDDETKVSFVNDEAEKMLAVRGEEIVGRSWVEFVHEDEVEKLLEYSRLRSIDPGLAPKTFETKIVDRKGNVRRILLNISMIPGTKDRIASFIDITDLRKTQEKLKESEERYRTLFEKSRDGIVLTGLDMKIIDCNEAALAMSGLSKEDVVGKTFLDLGIVEKDDVSLVMEKFYRGVREQIETFELRVRLKGEVKWIEISPTTLTRDGKSFAILTIIRDVTERKELEEKLKLSLERLRILHELDMGVIEGKPFKNISKLVLHRLRELLDFEVAGLFKLDEDRRNLIVECSDGKVKFFEDGSEVPFTPIAMENLKKGEISYVRNLLDLEHHTELEMGLLRGGMRSYVHVPLVVRRELVGVLCLAAGKSSAFDGKLKFIKEISDQLAIAFHEAELFEMKVRSLKRLEKNVEEFAILVDHIRNPLSIISGTIELEIEDENVREVIDEAVKKIEDVVSRLDRGWLESEQIRDFLKKPRV